MICMASRFDCHTNHWGWRCCRAITAAAAVTAGASRKLAAGRHVARVGNADRCTRRREPVLFSAAQPDPLLSFRVRRFRPSGAGAASLAPLRSRSFDPAVARLVIMFAYPRV